MERKAKMPALRCMTGVLQVLASFSAFLLLFASFSWFCTSPVSVLYFSSLVSNFSGNYVDKNMVFLLCNGIILCVSVLPGMGSFSAQNMQEEAVKLQSKPSFEEMEGLAYEKKVNLKSSGSVEMAVLEVEQKQIQEQEDEEEEEESEIEDVVIPKLESDERFDDFIRRTREQMGIASQMVHAHTV